MKAEGPNVWKEWIDLHTERGLPTPTPDGSNTSAGKRIGRLIPNAAERQAVLRAYLSCKERFLDDEQHALRLLPARLDKFKRLAAQNMERREYERPHYCTSCRKVRVTIPGDICTPCLKAQDAKRKPETLDVPVRLKAALGGALK